MNPQAWLKSAQTNFLWMAGRPSTRVQPVRVARLRAISSALALVGGMARQSTAALARRPPRRLRRRRRAQGRASPAGRSGQAGGEGDVRLEQPGDGAAGLGVLGGLGEGLAG